MPTSPALHHNLIDFREKLQNSCRKSTIFALQFGFIWVAGGSISNMYALMIARHKIYPQHKKHGMRAIKGQLIMYTSKHVRRHFLSMCFSPGSSGKSHFAALLPRSSIQPEIRKKDSYLERQGCCINISFRLSSDKGGDMMCDMW